MSFNYFSFNLRNDPNISAIHEDQSWENIGLGFDEDQHSTPCSKTNTSNSLNRSSKNLKRKKSFSTSKNSTKSLINISTGFNDENLQIDSVSSEDEKECTNSKRSKLASRINVNENCSNSFTNRFLSKQNSFSQSTPKICLKQKKTNQQVSSLSSNSQNISQSDSPITKKTSSKTINKIQLKKNLVKDLETLRTSGISEFNNVISPIKSTILFSQRISQTNSPTKSQLDSMHQNESKSFIKLSKKLNKELDIFLLKKSKNLINFEENTILQIKFLNSIQNLIEERRKWIHTIKSEKTDNCLQNKSIKRKSLFLKLLKIQNKDNRLVFCETILDLNLMKDVYIFNYSKLILVLSQNCANELSISENALIEIISPWNVIDCDILKTSFIVNPFWLFVLDHGNLSYSPKDNQENYEEIFSFSTCK